MLKILRSLSRILVGSVFIFSGFVKAVDPLGSTYKFTDYFEAFGLEFFVPLALPLALLLSSVELVMGISLLLGYRMKTVAWAVLLFMSFFTILTFILAIFNPVTDCGCFGDALILTNWQTFWKNIVLMVFTLIIFSGRRSFPEVRGAFAEWGILLIFFLAVLDLSFYCKNHLPILDFMPYKIGTNIPKATSIPEGAPSDVYETHLFYKNVADGKTKEFGIDNFPQDTLWKFVDSKSVLISEGYKPPIHDFSIASPNKEDLTETIKNQKGFVFLLVSYNLKKADKNALKKAADYYKLTAVFNDVDFYAVTASVDEDIRNAKDTLGLIYDFGSADEIALKTMVRSNPGLLLIKNGTILGKWHYNDFPEVKDIEAEFGDMVTKYPMAKGVDLRKLKTVPDGARSDVFETTLMYRNTVNDSVVNFRMDNFPKAAEWEFVSSHSEKISSGFNSPLENFKMITAEGVNIADKVIQQDGDVFLISAKEPHNLDPEMLERLNKLSVTAASISQGPVFFYAITGLEPDQIYGFMDSFISPITFCSGPGAFVETISGKGVSLIHIKNGVVTGRWDNSVIPEPAKLLEIISQPTGNRSFEPVVMPYLVEKTRVLSEEKKVMIIILGFFFLVMFIRVFMEDPYKNQK
jgi:uncharacterized membrane protein YphA (DoxX/SURF4 family)